MDNKLRILILEDSPYDAEMVQRLLLKEKPQYKFILATDKETYLQALDNFMPDVILSDHSLPQFDSMQALSIARMRFPDIPFIMVTGAVSEIFAADIIKAGADDYILKDRLNRLPESIIAALKKRKAAIEKQDEKEKTIQSESNLRAIFENTHEGFLLLTKDAVVKALNSKVTEYAFFVKDKQIQTGDCMYDFVEESRIGFFRQMMARVIEGESILYEQYYERTNSRFKWIEFSVTPVKELGMVTGICFTGRDITLKKTTEQERDVDRNNLAALINNTKDLMWSVGRDFKLMTFNNAFTEMMHVVYNDTIKKGNSILVNSMGNEQMMLMKGCYEKAFLGESFTETIHENNSWNEVSFYPIYNAGEIIGTACFSHDITQRKINEAHVKSMEQEISRQQVQEQKKISRAIIKAQEKERNHLGEELHDNINQLLAGTKLYMNIAGAEDEKFKKLIEYPIELIDNCMEEIRLLSSKLVAPIKNINLHTLTNDLLATYNNTNVLKINFTYAIPNKFLTDELKLNIYRITQEQVNNIWKYAEAKNVAITMKATDEAIEIVIADDGQGFDTSTKKNGIGILNMENRIRSFNGKVAIESSHGKGCTVFISIPVVQ